MMSTGFAFDQIGGMVVQQVVQAVKGKVESKVFDGTKNATHVRVEQTNRAAHAFVQGQLHALHKAKKKTKDGLADGQIDDPRACRFDPSVLLCTGPDGADCLTAPQVAAVMKIYAGCNPRFRRCYIQKATRMPGSRSIAPLSAKSNRRGPGFRAPCCGHSR